MSLLDQRLAWQRIVRSGRPAGMSVGVLATFTANSLAPYLGLALEEAELPADVWIGPYHQIMPQCLDVTSETSERRPDVLLVFARLEELWSGMPRPLSADLDHAEAALQVAEAALSAAQRLGSTLVFVLPALPEALPLGVGDPGHLFGVHATATAVREQLRERLSRRPGVLVADMEAVIRQLGASRAYHPTMEVVARIPYSEDAFHGLGLQVARLLELSRRPACKVVVVDADNTLWGGVVGEDGADGIDLADNGPGEAFRAFQDYLLDLRAAGVLLALCSKNREEDVWAAFERPEMRLKREHLAAWQINWQPKSGNIRAIADELGLSPDSFVFIDDNPAELAEVGAALPMVRAIRMPEDPAQWLTALQSSRMLDRFPPTAEDRQRAEQYQEEKARETLRAQLSPEAYLASLALTVAVLPPAPSRMARLHQLIHKTNQFNLNCRRHTEAELEVLVADPARAIRLVHAVDRFGDYGVVGAYGVVVDEDTATLDLFVLSCRAMGKGIEQAMIASAWDEAAARGARVLVTTTEEHPRNEPARSFFARLGAPVGAGVRPLTTGPWPVHIAIPTQKESS